MFPHFLSFLFDLFLGVANFYMYKESRSRFRSITLFTSLSFFLLAAYHFYQLFV